MKKMINKESDERVRRAMKVPCRCDGSGEIVVCSLCEENESHSHCDDSYRMPCSCSKNKEKTLKGGL